MKYSNSLGLDMKISIPARTTAIAIPPPGKFFIQSNCGQANHTSAKTNATLPNVPNAHTCPASTGPVP